MLRALALLENDTGPYGELLSEAFDPDADPNNRDSHFRYVAGHYDERTKMYGPRVNYAAKAAQDAQERFYKEFPDGNRAGHVWPVKRIRVRED